MKTSHRFKFWQHWVSLPKQQGVRDFVQICTEFRNRPAFADKYSSKLAFSCPNTVKSLIMSSAQVICVQQMSEPKLFVHQRSNLINAAWHTLPMHKADVPLREIAWSNILARLQTWRVIFFSRVCLSLCPSVCLWPALLPFTVDWFWWNLVTRIVLWSSLAATIMVAEGPRNAFLKI